MKNKKKRKSIFFNYCPFLLFQKRKTKCQNESIFKNLKVIYTSVLHTYTNLLEKRREFLFFSKEKTNYEYIEFHRYMNTSIWLKKIEVCDMSYY
jgi:hypothetical protein